MTNNNGPVSFEGTMPSGTFGIKIQLEFPYTLVDISNIVGCPAGVQ